jgi:AcrR family transcriptional regulator
MPRPRPNAAAELDARMRLKRAARRLFAERGFRNVTVREVATAAGQKNHAAVGYYFGAKENLAKEILVDGAMVIEARRKALLDEIEAGPRPPGVRELVEAIVLPSAELVSGDPDEEQYFNRFLADLGSNHPAMILEALEGRWNIGYQRCLRLLRPLMGELSAAEKNRRFVFLGAYVGAILALRESILADRTRGHLIWRSDSTLQDVVETATAILTAPRPAK